MSVTLDVPTMAGAGNHAQARPEHRTLSVIIPVFNERTTVAEIIRRLQSVTIPLELEIVVVNDASTDGTSEALASLADATLRIIDHPTNRGKGAAVRTGLSAATGDIVLIQDADLEYNPSDLPHLLAPLLSGTASVVYGNRFKGDCRNMTRLHWLGNRFLSFVTSVLYSSSVSDMNTCYKLFDRRILDDISLRSERFDFDPEITAKILRRGHRIHEVPVSYSARTVSEGKKITWRDGGSVLAALVRYRVVSPLSRGPG